MRGSLDPDPAPYGECGSGTGLTCWWIWVFSFYFYFLDPDLDPHSERSSGCGSRSLWRQMRIQDPDPNKNQCESATLFHGHQSHVSGHHCCFPGHCCHLLGKKKLKTKSMLLLWFVCFAWFRFWLVSFRILNFLFRFKAKQGKLGGQFRYFASKKFASVSLRSEIRGHLE